MDNNSGEIQLGQGIAVLVSLTRKQHRAIQALVEHQNIKDVVKFAGISESTLYRWLKQDNFRSTLQFALQQTSKEMIRRLVAGRSKALDTLEELLDAKSESVRRNAARDWLELAYQHQEMQNLESRLSEIERKLK